MTTMLTMEQVWTRVEATGRKLLETQSATEVAVILLGGADLPDTAVGIMKLRSIMTTPEFHPTEDETRELYRRIMKLLGDYAVEIGIPQNSNNELFKLIMGGINDVVERSVSHLSLGACQMAIDEPDKLHKVTAIATLDLIVLGLATGRPFTEDEQKALMKVIQERTMAAVVARAAKLKGEA